MDTALDLRARHDIDPYWSPFHQVKELKEQALEGSEWTINITQFYKLLAIY